MSNTQKNTPATSPANIPTSKPETENATEDKPFRVIPQADADKMDRDEYIKSIAMDSLTSDLKRVERSLAEVYKTGANIKITRDDEGQFHAEIVEDEPVGKRFVGKAKDFYHRNKKTVIAAAAFTAASLVTKALLANREQVEEPMEGELATEQNASTDNYGA